VRGRLQRDCANEWRARTARLIQRTVRLPDDPAPLQAAPAHGGWSAAQILEHLVLSSGSYLTVMRERTERAVPTEGADPSWRPSLSGRMLAWSMTSRRRFPAPRGWVPDVTPRPHVVEAWIAELRELDTLLDRMVPVPWNRIRFHSPVTMLLRLNLGDGFLGLVSHAERHFAQIDRTLAATGVVTAS